MECPFAKQATEAFLVFDSEKTETVDVREVGTIIRSLGKMLLFCRVRKLPKRAFPMTKGCCPSESELQHLVTSMEGEGTHGLVRLQKFVPIVSGVLQQKR